MGFWLVGAEIILVMTACGACTGGIIHTLCGSMRKSRCSKIKCLCFSCDREIESDELIIAEEELENKRSAPSGQI